MCCARGRERISRYALILFATITPTHSAFAPAVPSLNCHAHLTEKQELHLLSRRHNIICALHMREDVLIVRGVVSYVNIHTNVWYGLDGGVLLASDWVVYCSRVIARIKASASVLHARESVYSNCVECLWRDFILHLWFLWFVCFIRYVYSACGWSIVVGVAKISDYVFLSLCCSAACTNESASTQSIASRQASHTMYNYAIRTERTDTRTALTRTKQLYYV